MKSLRFLFTLVCFTCTTLPLLAGAGAPATDQMVLSAESPAAAADMAPEASTHHATNWATLALIPIILLTFLFPVLAPRMLPGFADKFQASQLRAQP